MLPLVLVVRCRERIQQNMTADFKSRVMCAGKKYAQRKSKQVGVSARSLSAPRLWPWTILANSLQLGVILPAAHRPLVSVEVDGRVPGVSSVARGALVEVVFEHAKVEDAYDAACKLLL